MLKLDETMLFCATVVASEQCPSFSLRMLQTSWRRMVWIYFILPVRRTSRSSLLWLVTQSCLTLCDPMDYSLSGSSVHGDSPGKNTGVGCHALLQGWVSDAIQPSHPLSSPSPPALNPSQHQGLFQLVNSSHEVAKVLSFSFTISPSKETPGLISFRMDWLDLLAVQGTLKSLLQHHSSKASILRCSAFFTV